MNDSNPPEFRFGLPVEVEAALSANVDEPDDWQLEELMTEAAFAYDDQQLASGAVPDPEPFGDGFFFLSEEFTWGIDEPMTAADWAFLDEEEW